MEDYKVPTTMLAVEVLLSDGRTLAGSVFLPALSAVQVGPMPPEEWINGGFRFFPFRPTDRDTATILNRDQVIALTVVGGTPLATSDADAEWPVHHLAVEAGVRRFEGTVVIDTPINQRRVVDFLNGPGLFLVVQEADRYHLVRKSEIARVSELEA